MKVSGSGTCDDMKSPLEIDASIGVNKEREGGADIVDIHTLSGVPHIVEDLLAVGDYSAEPAPVHIDQEMCISQESDFRYYVRVSDSYLDGSLNGATRNIANMKTGRRVRVEILERTGGYH